jgi:hypothetical protein
VAVSPQAVTPASRSARSVAWSQVGDLVGGLALVLQDSPPHFGRLRVAGPLRDAAEKLVRRDLGVLLHVAVAGQPARRIRGARGLDSLRHRREAAAELLELGGAFAVRLDPLADQPLVLVVVLEELVQLRVVGRLGRRLRHL